MELGPRVYQRGRWFWADLRPWDGDRIVLRNPAHGRWPEHGDRTDDREVAERWKWKYVDLARTEKKRQDLGLPASTADRLGDEAERWLTHCERTLSPRSMDSVTTVIRVHLVPFIGAGVQIDAIGRRLVQAWIDHLIDLEYAVTTIETYRAWARAFFRWRSDDRHDPTAGVELPRRAARDVEPWSDADLVKLRKAADRLDRKGPALKGPASPLAGYRLLLELALATGARVAELAAITWSSIDETTKTVRLRWQAGRDGGRLDPLKGRRNRTALVLHEWWPFHRRRAEGRVILAGEDVSVALRTMQTWFTELQIEAGVKRAGMNAHRSRHTYARRCLAMGVRLEELQHFLGHASIQTTEQSYGWMTDQSAAQLARERIYGEAARPKLRRVR